MAEGPAPPGRGDPEDLRRIREARETLGTAEEGVRMAEAELRRAREELRTAQDRRRRVVMEARERGASYAQIADVLGVSVQRARAIAADAVFKARRERLYTDGGT